MANSENRYPNDIASFITKTKAFSIETHLTLNRESSPLKIFHESFSRFVFVAADLTKKENKAATANIHISDLSGIVRKTDYAFAKYMDAANAVSGTENGNNSNPAYTERFATGSLKGKSPAEVLMESGAKGIKILDDQYAFLEKNAEKYPNNKKLMNAIMEAKKLNPEEMSSEASLKTSGKPVNILTVTTRPLIRKKRNDGRCFCYELKVDYMPGNRYPVVISVTNYYAPVKENENGTLNVILSQKDTSSVIDNQIYLSLEDWLYAVDEMVSARDNFKAINFKDAIELSETMQKEARENIPRKESKTGIAKIPLPMPAK